MTDDVLKWSPTAFDAAYLRLKTAPAQLTDQDLEQLSIFDPALMQQGIERRFKARKKARASLETADATFADLGAIRWSERARDAIARLGRVVGSWELTPTERRVAELIIDGKTNREIADSLFLSIKTVEANVSRILAKLGVGSRREVASRLVGDVEAPVPAMLVERPGHREEGERPGMR